MPDDLRPACIAVGNLAAEHERLREENHLLRNCVLAASADMHRVSMRPCGTCMGMSRALREPWGCYAFQAKQGQPVPKFS